MKTDALSVVEAAYADRPVEAWLRGLAEVALPFLDGGFGVQANVFEVQPGRGTLASQMIVASSAESAERAEYALRVFLARWPALEGSIIVPEVFSYPRAPLFGRLSETMRLEKPIQELFDASGSSGMDVVGILAGDPSGFGVCVAGPTDRVRTLSAAERRLWTMVAVHVAAGYRILRGRKESRVDAVLDSAGRVQHAEAEATTKGARESLRVAARAIDRARGRLRRAAPEDALTLWRGLVDGKWSLVEQVDSDGKRFLFAKRNAPQPRPWHVLSERELQVVAYAAEGHAHKLIAYELGISESASTRHLQSAARKLGVRTRADLVREYRAALA